MATFPLPPTDQGHGDVSWTEAQSAEIEGMIARYPEKRAAVMPVLWLAQDHFGWLSLDVLRLVAKTLELPPSHVLSVATFYTMFKKQPTGTHLLQVCHTLSCDLAGAEGLITRIQNKLGIKVGETTADGKFTLQRVECLAACGSGPMMQVGTDYYELLKDDTAIDAVLDALASDNPPSLPRPEMDQWTYTRKS
ncbi:MAG: NAD(P)H-dependent oxidoreductase subunit E [Myxococcota bacterium]|nr:NAD(P)H-dependent oxidoreductase subunit E [Myxococcota bacterium]